MGNKKNFIKDLLSAIRFITIIPAGKGYEFSPSGMIRFFPVVGMIIGVMLIAIDGVVSLLWTDMTTAIIDTLFLVIITGGFHMDGVGDTADGLFSHRSRERALEIMKDSRTGMMGLMAVFFVLSLKTAGIYGVKISGNAWDTVWLFLAIPALSRSAMIFGIRFLEYGRKDQGTGQDFFKEKLQAKDFFWAVLPVLVLFVLGLKGVALVLVFLATTGLVLFYYQRKMGCITGDMLGAVSEVSETILFLFAGIQLI